jgi:TPR repeat protein
MYAQGSGVPKDEARTAALFEQACSGNSADGCGNLGLMYENGSGVSNDVARAVTLYKQACNWGLAAGCEDMKRLK